MSVRARLEAAVSRVRPSANRTPELDGLRGIAVLLVLWAHLLSGVSPFNRPFVPGMPNLLPGGGLTGVQLFFVLSGYLITSILIKDFGKRQASALPRFYGRRAKRLLPALIVICAVYAVLVLMRSGEPRRLGLGSIWAALTYTTNFPIFDNDGYLGHTWSLAVEEQFYLVWPILLFATLRFGGRRLATVTALVLLVATVVLRHALDISDNASWTNFRWDALMIGALIALNPIRIGWFAGVLGMVVLGYFSVTPVTYQPEVYTLTAIASAVILLAAPSHRWLQNPVLQYFGLISYGLYLWSLLIMRYGLPGPIALVLSIAVATLSCVFIELPVLKWRFRRKAS